MESLPGHAWRQYLYSGEHHQVADPAQPDDTGMVWAACTGGGITDLWAPETDPDGEPRCLQCLVLVGSHATARRARRIAEQGSQSSAAFRAINTDGPVVRATATRLDQPDPSTMPPPRELAAGEA